MGQCIQGYNLVENSIRRLYDSKLRLSILWTLSQNPMRLSDLRREVDANAPNTSAKVKELSKLGLVERTEHGFILTAYGKAVRKRVKESICFHTSYEKFKDFWETHDTSLIQESLWDKIGDINKSNVIKDPIGVEKMIIDHINSTESSLFIIVPDSRWDNILQMKNQDINLIKDDNLPCLVISNKQMILSLKSKMHDMHLLDSCIHSVDFRAIGWAKKLFESLILKEN